MKKSVIKFSNELHIANWNRVNLTHLPNNTTNSVITPAMFNRECKEFDDGILPNEHDLYLGERYAQYITL